MKLALILIALLLTACGGQDSATVADPQSCEHQAEVERVTYPDGIKRKSEVTICQSKATTCTYYTWVNDSSITFSDCH